MNNEQPFTVVVAEDEELIRSGLIRKIKKANLAIEIIGEASNGKQAIEIISKQPPHLLITDIRMPMMDGLELIRKIHSDFPSIAVIITSGYADFEYAREAMRFQVNHYILKPIKNKELIDALQTVKNNKQNEIVHTTLSVESTVEQVKQYLKNNFKQDLNMEQIAAKFNFSSAYLSKIFLKHTGEAPSRYVMKLRINQAKSLLQNQPHLPIKEVGDHVGYADPYYFSRIFKQNVGMTPSEFRHG
ncbi:response regulator [Paenibacillus yanchengensis]|uniref:Response regulator n=1 Tax=Paenibacillus yanchengensis TaxID=2035833 RepID=A0ABW4YG28_9BACL